MASNMWSDGGFHVNGMTPNSGTVLCSSIDAAIVPVGSTAAQGTQLVSSLNICVPIAASTGVRLPAVSAKGAVVRVINNSGTVFTAYPNTGGTINGGSVDAGVTIAAASGGVAGSKSFAQTADSTWLQV